MKEFRPGSALFRNAAKNANAVLVFGDRRSAEGRSSQKFKKFKKFGADARGLLKAFSFPGLKVLPPVGYASSEGDPKPKIAFVFLRGRRRAAMPAGMHNLPVRSLPRD